MVECLELFASKKTFSHLTSQLIKKTTNLGESRLSGFVFNGYRGANCQTTNFNTPFSCKKFAKKATRLILGRSFLFKHPQGGKVWAKFFSKKQKSQIPCRFQTFANFRIAIKTTSKKFQTSSKLSFETRTGINGKS